MLGMEANQGLSFNQWDKPSGNHMNYGNAGSQNISFGGGQPSVYNPSPPSHIAGISQGNSIYVQHQQTFSSNQSRPKKSTGFLELDDDDKSNPFGEDVSLPQPRAPIFEGVNFHSQSNAQQGSFWDARAPAIQEPYVKPVQAENNTIWAQFEQPKTNPIYQQNSNEIDLLS